MLPSFKSGHQTSTHFLEVMGSSFHGRVRPSRAWQSWGDQSLLLRLELSLDRQPLASPPDRLVQRLLQKSRLRESSRQMISLKCIQLNSLRSSETIASSGKISAKRIVWRRLFPCTLARTRRSIVQTGPTQCCPQGSFRCSRACQEEPVPAWRIGSELGRSVGTLAPRIEHLVQFDAVKARLAHAMLDLERHPELLP